MLMNMTGYVRLFHVLVRFPVEKMYLRQPEYSEIF